MKLNTKILKYDIRKYGSWIRIFSFGIKIKHKDCFMIYSDRNKRPLKIGNYYIYKV